MKDRSRSKRRGSGAAWLAVVATSALLLAVVSGIAFVAAIDDALDAADALFWRDAHLQVELVERALTDPATLDAAPAECRFALDAGGALPGLDAELAGLRELRAFEPAAFFDILALERLRRASLADDAGAAIAELQPLVDDPATPPRARSWLGLRIAWLAQRGGLAARRDEALARHGARSADADPAQQLSAVLLQVERDAGLSAETERIAKAAIVRVERGTAAAFLARLAERGIPTSELAAVAEAADRRRELLRTLVGEQARLRAARAPIAEPLAGRLLLYWPARAQGALLDPAGFERALTWLPSDRWAVQVGGEPQGGLAIAGGFAWLLSTATVVRSPLAGPLGALLLTASLALGCAAASVLAVRALRREREALRLRSEFLTTVTHELKTPLAGLRLVAELLSGGHVTGTEERALWLRRLEGEAARLGMLIENLLDLRRGERGETPHAPERCDLVALCRETLALFEALAERDGIELRLSLPAGPIEAAVDRAAFRQLLLNLLDNARKYGAAPIELALNAEGGCATLRVRDHGPGVAAADAARIFERFRRGGAQEHGSIPGVGLGLHLARGIAERHGGTLELEAVGEGACFVLRLPRAAAVTAVSA